MEKQSSKFKDIHDRIFKFFDEKNCVAYERIDTQTIPCKQYFLTLVLKFEPSKAPDRNGAPNTQQHFSTLNRPIGATSLEEMYQQWVEEFISLNSRRIARHTDNYPSELTCLDASSPSELLLKMSIVGM